MEAPKVNINFNIDVKLDPTHPSQIKVQIEDAVIRAATAVDSFKRIGYSTERTHERKLPEPKTNHQRVVAANVRISEAIEDINALIDQIANGPTHQVSSDDVVNMLRSIRSTLLKK